MNVLEM